MSQTPASNTAAEQVLETWIAKLSERFQGKPGQFQDMRSVTLEKDQLVAAIAASKDAGFVMLSDIFGIDYLSYPGHQGKRFSVVYSLYHLESSARIFLRFNLDDGESLPSIMALWPAANFMEREVYDMFGVEFDGHPDLRKLITPEDLDGHPHRKDFPLGETPTLFNDGRFLDPAAFRSGLSGKDQGLSGWRGGTRKGVTRDD